MVLTSLMLNLFTILVVIITVLYFYSTRKFKFWKRLGVPFVSPLPFFGSLKDIALLKISVGNYLKKIYDEYKGERYVGILSFDQPAIVLRDLEIVKNVLVKDFQYFGDHYLVSDMDTLARRNLFMIKGQRWKQMRKYMSPTFTSGKIKNMFFLVERCAQELDKYLDIATAKGSSVKVKEISGKFTIETIASCAFGIDSNSLKDPKAEFTIRLNKAFEFDSFRAFKSTFFIFKPKLLKLLRMMMFDPDLDDFVRRTVWNTMDYREKHNILRNDFLDNLRELRKKIRSDRNCDDLLSKIDDDDYAAQAFVFLLAGFDTSSKTISFTLYELALQPGVQSRLRDEICQVLQKHNNDVTYETIQEMKYLDMVVKETLRKYPPLPFIDRQSTADYEFPAPTGRGTITIPKGTAVYIPLLGLHYDPEYYPEPDKYDPERFTEENKQKRPNYSYMAFGEGPRTCIGKRFGLMTTKAALIHVLSRYVLEPCKETQIPLVLDKKSFLLKPKGDVTLSFKKITT